MINKELNPGDSIPSENELAETLRVSKSSVREAIKMLEALGVVEIKRGIGTFIKRIAADDYLNPFIFQLLLMQGENEDIIELRGMYEMAFSRMALEKATDLELLKIKKTIDQFENNLKRGNSKPEDDIAFHYAVLNSTGNPYVIKIGENLLQLFWSTIKTAFKVDPKTALASHKNIYKAIKEKDLKALTDALSKSLKEWEKQWMSQL